jgi:hypothetical protein
MASWLGSALLNCACAALQKLSSHATPGCTRAAAKPQMSLQAGSQQQQQQQQKHQRQRPQRQQRIGPAQGVAAA